MAQGLVPRAAFEQAWSFDLRSSHDRMKAGALGYGMAVSLATSIKVMALVY